MLCASVCNVTRQVKYSAALPCLHPPLLHTCARTHRQELSLRRQLYLCTADSHLTDLPYRRSRINKWRLIRDILRATAQQKQSQLARQPAGGQDSRYLTLVTRILPLLSLPQTHSVPTCVHLSADEFIWGEQNSWTQMASFLLQLFQKFRSDIKKKMWSLQKLLPPADVSKLRCVRSRVWAYFYAALVQKKYASPSSSASLAKPCVSFESTLLKCWEAATGSKVSWRWLTPTCT